MLSLHLPLSYALQLSFFFTFFYYYFCNMIFSLQTSNLLSKTSTLLPLWAFQDCFWSWWNLKKNAIQCCQVTHSLTFSPMYCIKQLKVYSTSFPERWVHNFSSFPTTPQSCFCHLDCTHENERTLPAITLLFMQWCAATCAHHYVGKEGISTLQSLVV